MKMKEIKIEGYWYSKYEPQYPNGFGPEILQNIMS